MRCCITGCTSSNSRINKTTGNDNLKISMFRFPSKYMHSRVKWIEATRVSPTPSTRICSLHFEEKYFRPNHGQELRPRLAPNAVPSLLLGKNYAADMRLYENLEEVEYEAKYLLSDVEVVVENGTLFSFVSASTQSTDDPLCSGGKCKEEMIEIKEEIDFLSEDESILENDFEVSLTMPSTHISEPYVDDNDDDSDIGRSPLGKQEPIENEYKYVPPETFFEVNIEEGSEPAPTTQISAQNICTNLGDNVFILKASAEYLARKEKFMQMALSYATGNSLKDIDTSKIQLVPMIAAEESLTYSNTPQNHLTQSTNIDRDPLNDFDTPSVELLLPPSNAVQNHVEDLTRRMTLMRAIVSSDEDDGFSNPQLDSEKIRVLRAAVDKKDRKLKGLKQKMRRQTKVIATMAANIKILQKGGNPVDAAVYTPDSSTLSDSESITP